MLTKIHSHKIQNQSDIIYRTPLKKVSSQDVYYICILIDQLFEKLNTDKTMNRLLHSIAVSLALLFLSEPWMKAYANDGDTFVCESPEGIKLNFRIVSEQEKTAEVTGMAEDKPISDYGQLTIPADANGYAVVSIGKSAFEGSSFKSVFISEGVQRIEDSAFFNCQRTKTIKLPSTILFLGDFSLLCENLEMVISMIENPADMYFSIFDSELSVGAKNNAGYSVDIGTWEYGVYQRAVLFVPKGTKNKYKKTIPWAYFSTIEEMYPDNRVPLLYDYQRTAFNLFSELADSKLTTDNICFSPLSAQLALSMLQNGADGNTLKEMKWAMGLSEYSDGEINLFNQALTQSITTRPEFLPEQWKWYADTEEEARKYYDAEYPVCEIANSIWHRPDITLFDSFTDTVRSYYDAGIGSVRFDTQEGIDQINQWVSDKTHTLIPKIYNEPQSAELALVLANALYFKGAWHTPFDKANTRPGVFHNANGSNVMTDMMTVRAEYQSTTTDKFQTVTLPYGNGDFSMTIFLPVEGTKLPDLTRADWIQTVSQPQQFRPYALTFPRFDFGDSHELNDILKKMGMSEAFDKDKADFTRMTDCQTFISKVLQLNKISVDEAGTEAAAVTIIGMDTEGMEDPDPINYEPFRIDQPFYFTIENRKEKAVLFVGRVATLEGEPFTSKPADVNQDNTVDISDIVAVINVIAGTDSNDKADVNADGKTDISDIVAIINSIAR